MARLGRRQPDLVSNRIRKPTVVGPIAILPPITTRLAVQKTRQQYLVRDFKQQSVVRAPTIVGPIAILPPIKERLAVEQHRVATAPFRQPKSRLNPPRVLQQVIAPDTGITATSSINGTLSNVVPITGTLTASSTVTGTVTDTATAVAIVKTTLVMGRRGTRGTLLPPTIVGQAATIQAPVATKLVVHSTAVQTRPDMVRRAPKSVVRPPATLTPPPATPTQDQLRIRKQIPQQPRRLPARATFISPAIVNPIILDFKNQVATKTTLAAVNNRVSMRMRAPRSRYIKAAVTGGLAAVQPAAVNATSTVTATVSNIVPVIPAALSATSTITGVVTHFPQLTGSLTATSTIFSTITGGSVVVATTDQHPPYAVKQHLN